MGKHYLRYLGNLSILIGLLGLFITFGPYLWEEWRYRTGKPVELADSFDDYHMVIPAIGVSATVIAGVDPFNRSVYLEALQQGVAQAKGTALPGQPGTQYLFAHSSDAPWRISRYNTVFYRLGKLQAGDAIEIWYGGHLYRYLVTELLTVWPTETAYITESDEEDRLIVQTCTPIGTDWQRLLVLAQPVDGREQDDGRQPS